MRGRRDEEDTDASWLWDDDPVSEPVHDLAPERPPRPGRAHATPARRFPPDLVAQARSALPESLGRQHLLDLALLLLAVVVVVLVLLALRG